MKITKPIFVVASAVAALFFSTAITVSAQDKVTLTNPGPGPFTSFFDVYFQVGSVGEWYELPYTPGYSTQIRVQDTNGVPQTLSNAGFFLSNTEIPLDQLNNPADYPLPGSPSSPYTPLPSLDNSLTANGCELSSSLSVPDQASTSALCSMAVGALLFARRFAQPKRL